MKYAFFDLDNTVYNGYSATEAVYYMHAHNLADKQIKKRHDMQVEKYNKRQITYSELVQTVLDMVSLSFKGHRVEAVSGLVDDLLKTKRHVFFDWVNPVFDYLRKDGYLTYLVSAGPDLIVKAIAGQLKTDGWFATTITQKNGIYDGGSARLLNDELKQQAVASKVGLKDFSVAFGDSPGDVPMLESVNRAFVVRNDHHKEILEIAGAKGWTVFREAEEVIRELNKF